mgnify:CR=1 FL=1
MRLSPGAAMPNNSSSQSSISKLTVTGKTSTVFRSGWHLWWMAVLQRTLSISATPALVGTAADFESGNDQSDRVGPRRVSAEGGTNPASVSRAAFLSFTVALLLGIYLVALGGWPILLAGLASLLAGWSYSGGPRPVSPFTPGRPFCSALLRAGCCRR